MGRMMMLNQIDKKVGLKRIFINKDSVMNVSRLKIGGRTGNTSITYESRNGRKCIVSVLEEPSYVMNKIAGG
jgi:hypothetical protein